MAEIVAAMIVLNGAIIAIAAWHNRRIARQLRLLRRLHCRPPGRPPA